MEVYGYATSNSGDIPQIDLFKVISYWDENNTSWNSWPSIGSRISSVDFTNEGRPSWYLLILLH